MSSEVDMRRNVVKRSSLDEPNRIHPNLTQDTTANGSFTSPLGKPYPFFVPSSVKKTILYLSLMQWRVVTVTNAYIGNFFFTAGVGMVISAQWELILGNSFGYTILSDFGFFYSSFGAIVTPLFGVQDSYGTNTAGYNNTLDFFVLMWAILSLFFLFGSLLINIVYIGIFFVELAFALIAASYFATANGKPDGATALKKAGGVFESLAGLLGYYDAAAHLMYQT